MSSLQMISCQGDLPNTRPTSQEKIKVQIYCASKRVELYVCAHMCMYVCALCTHMYCNMSYLFYVLLANHIDSTNSRSSAVFSKGHANPLSPTEAAMDAWNPMESHFLSNWNLYKESANDGWSDRGKGKHIPDC